MVRQARPSRPRRRHGGQAIDAYQPKLRGSDNKARLELHVGPALSKRPIALLTANELTKWRDGLTKTVAPATVNRIATVLRAALNQRADADDTNASRRAWEIGLAAIEGAEQSRNVILSDGVVRNIVAEAYQASAEFGRLVDLAAVTGARYDQLARAEVQDLRGTGDTAAVMIPRSKKGKGEKAIPNYSVPIRPPWLMRSASPLPIGPLPTSSC